MPSSMLWEKMAHLHAILGQNDEYIFIVGKNNLTQWPEFGEIKDYSHTILGDT